MERVVGRVGYRMRMNLGCVKPVRLANGSVKHWGWRTRGWAVASLGAVSVALTTVPTVASSQEPSDQHGLESRQSFPLSEIGRRLEVTVALSDSLRGNRPVILRRPGNKAANLIVLPSSTVTEVKLLEAIVTLLAAHKGHGDRLGDQAILRSRDGKVPRLWSPAEVGRASRVLSRLRAEQPNQLEGVGRVRHVVIYLREDALRGRLQQRQR